MLASKKFKIVLLFRRMTPPLPPHCPSYCFPSPSSLSLSSSRLPSPLYIFCLLECVIESKQFICQLMLYPSLRPSPLTSHFSPSFSFPSPLLFLPSLLSLLILISSSQTQLSTRSSQSMQRNSSVDSFEGRPHRYSSPF